jgi:hypothetical protein
MVFKTFSPKKMAVFAITTANCSEKLIVTLVLEENANFFAENWQKSQKIVNITSTPGHFAVVEKKASQSVPVTKAPFSELEGRYKKPVPPKPVRKTPATTLINVQVHRRGPCYDFSFYLL